MTGTEEAARLHSYAEQRQMERLGPIQGDDIPVIPFIDYVHDQTCASKPGTEHSPMCNTARLLADDWRLQLRRAKAAEKIVGRVREVCLKYRAWASEEYASIPHWVLTVEDALGDEEFRADGSTASGVAPCRDAAGNPTDSLPHGQRGEAEEPNRCPRCMQFPPCNCGPGVGGGL